MKTKAQLKDIVSYSKGYQINGDELLDDGKYDYLNGGVLPSGKWNEYNTEAETVTVSEGGNSCGFVNYMQKPFWCGAHCYYLYDSKVNTKYLYYILKSQQDRLMKLRSGACMPNIKKSDLGKFEVIYDTDSNEQQKVIDVLDRISSIITARQQELQKFDELIKARFVEMFGDPESNSMEWHEDALSEHLSVIGGYAFKSDLFDEIKGVPILRIGNINAGFFKPINMVYWKKDEKLERYSIYPGDLVMSLTGTVGKDDYGNVCIMDDSFEMYYLNQRNAKLELQESINKYYLSYLLKFEQIKAKLTGISRGVRQANISNKDILNLVVPIPPIELQNKFADFVKQIDKSKVAVQKALDEAQLLFDSLMQEYFG